MNSVCPGHVCLEKPQEKPGSARLNQVTRMSLLVGPLLPCSGVHRLTLAREGKEEELCPRAMCKGTGQAPRRKTVRRGPDLRDLILALEDNLLVPRDEALSSCIPVPWMQTVVVWALA